MYGLWNLWAGTNGFFFPHVLRTVGSQSQGVGVLVQATGFGISAASARNTASISHAVRRRFRCAEFLPAVEPLRTRADRDGIHVAGVDPHRVPGQVAGNPQ